MDEYSIPDEPLITLRRDIKPDNTNIPVGRLADAYNRDVTKSFFKPVYEEDKVSGGYAISQDVLDTLALHTVERVFILERDTDLVWEFDIDSFNERVSDTDMIVADTADVLYKWPDLGFDLFTNNSLWGK